MAGGVARCSARPAPGSGRSPLRRPRRGRCGRRAGRPSRRSAPRRGSRGSAGSRRRRGSRSGSPRGSRGPWRPSGCRRGRRSRPRRSAARMRAWAPRPAAVSESSRKTGIGASRSASSASIRSVPAPARESVVEAHSRTGPRQRLGVGAVVADEAAAVAVDDQRDVAVGAVPVVPAGAAGEPGGEAAAVDHHDRLGAGARGRPPAPPRCRGAAAPSAGRPRACRAARTGGMRRPSTRRGSSSRGSSSQVSGRGVAVPATSTAPRPRRAPAGDGAGVVAGVALLLVGGVVLLVDHDQAEVADRGEDGRARADADARLAAAQAPPLVVALAGGEGRVEDREAVAEPGPEARHRLRREADLGDEDDRAAAARQRRLDRGQVDLGLARAGDAVQQLLARARRPRRRARRRSRSTAASCSGSSCGTAAGGAEPRCAGRAAQRASCGWRSGRAASSRRSVCAVGADRGGQLARADISPPRSASSTARCLTPSRSPPLSAASPAAGSRPAARPASGPRGPRPRSPAAAPAAGRARASSSTRGRPRGRARPAPAARPASSASIGSARRSGGSSEARRSSTTTPSSARRPNGHPDDAADLELRPSPPAGGSRTGRAERGRWSAARPWRSTSGHGMAATADADWLCCRAQSWRREPQPQPRGAGDLPGPSVLAGDPRLLPERDRWSRRSSA